MKAAALELAKSFGLFALARRATRRSLRILCYHGLWTSPGLPFGECLFMPVHQFEARMRWLAASCYPVLDLDEAVMRLADGTLPENAVVLTIDDGWRSTYTHMLPLLESLGLPATLYASTYYIERRSPVINVALAFIVDRMAGPMPDLSDLIPGVAIGKGSAVVDAVNRAIESLGDPAARVDALARIAGRAGVLFDPEDDQFRYITAVEIADAARRGMRIELHTHRHRSVTDARCDLDREIADNRAALVRAVPDRDAVHFCYPSGDYASFVEPVLHAAGIASATTTRRGLNPPGTHPYRLRRLLDGHRVTQCEFECYLAGGYEVIDRHRAI